MNIVEIIVIVLLLILITMTLIDEPMLSIKYGKAFMKSGINLVDWVVDKVPSNSTVTTTKLNNTETLL